MTEKIDKIERLKKIGNLSVVALVLILPLFLVGSLAGYTLAVQQFTPEPRTYDLQLPNPHPLNPGHHLQLLSGGVLVGNLSVDHSYLLLLPNVGGVEFLFLYNQTDQLFIPFDPYPGEITLFVFVHDYNGVVDWWSEVGHYNILILDRLEVV